MISKKIPKIKNEIQHSKNRHTETPCHKHIVPPLYGLVLTGGQSQRMKKDKALINYKGRPEALEAYDILNSFCKFTFISAKKNQWLNSELQSLPQIVDQFDHKGPINGILSAMCELSNTAFLVVACDLPFLDSETITTLIQQRDPSKFATGFFSEKFNGLPEPLCCIYEPSAFKALSEFANEGHHCPRKFLKNHPLKMIHLPKSNALDNINCPEEYQQALAQFNLNTSTQEHQKYE